jgi:hypothetical protein
LKTWGVNPPKKMFTRILRLIYDLLVLILYLYLPINKSKKAPDEKESEQLDLRYKKAIALVYVNPLRNFTEQFSTVRNSFAFDLKKLENGVIFPFSASGLCDWTGFSLKLSKKFLEYAKNILDWDSKREIAEHFMYDILYKIHSGDWSEMLDYNETLLDEAKRISQNQDFNPPLYIHSYLIGKFLLDLYLFEEATFSKERSNSIKHRKEAYRSGKKAINITKKLASNRVKVLRLMGRYYWLINRQKATKYWNFAINEGERLKARPDLARTYIEIGKRFLEEKSKYNELNGVTAEQYLEKAREMFIEMDLQWDLDELDRIVSYR